MGGVRFSGEDARCPNADNKRHSGEVLRTSCKPMQNAVLPWSRSRPGWVRDREPVLPFKKGLHYIRVQTATTPRAWVDTHPVAGRLLRRLCIISSNNHSY